MFLASKLLITIKIKESFHIELLKPELNKKVDHESPEGVKWELGLACFLPGKMGLSHWDWDLLNGNWEKN